MMDDIVERLRVPCIEFGLDEGWIDAERKEAANKIEALEARIAKADALATHADILLKQGLNTGVAKEIVVGNLVSTLAAYREGSDA